MAIIILICVNQSVSACRFASVYSAKLLSNAWEASVYLSPFGRDSWDSENGTSADKLLWIAHIPFPFFSALSCLYTIRTLCRTRVKGIFSSTFEH